MSCRIENLEDRLVFWIRNSDTTILTAGFTTFTADTRFKVNHENSVDATDWSLVITNVKMEDQGEYECQINTEPKMKLNINLMVKGETFFLFSSLNIHVNIFSTFCHHRLDFWQGERVRLSRQHVRVLIENIFFAELVEVMEMDSPFSGAMIEGKNFNVLKKGSTITLTCKVMENEIEGSDGNARRIDWLKNGEPINVQVIEIK